ncbi:M24 family metallopeptidase [Halocalculus aciditolerans]|uniref:Peptidase M24 n=1 Tax=Halocalculus aciditolerans TaxID=1383812 RepID=A0A830F782_9EURY|nr:Xaa-Pro peptidase family protein [Halocalculus aciditolerans]GGL70064.1 peptidase M24 [Halocalculus aciditolerans]
MPPTGDDAGGDSGRATPDRAASRPGYGALAAELAARDAVGFVAVGDRFDDDLRYLTRFSGPDRAWPFVYAGEEAFLCAPALFAEQAREEFAGTVLTQGDLAADAAGAQAAELLAEHAGLDGGTVLVPASLPHDAAVYLERAGFALESTDAVAEARRVKSAWEVERLREVQAAAQAGMARAETVLAEAAVRETDDRLVHEGVPVTTEYLRREVNAVLGAEGVSDAHNTVVAAGGACADLHFYGDVPVHADETVLLDVSPRGPEGYYGDLTRTFVVDSSGGWDRRAYLAVESAQDMAFDAIEAGAPAESVHEEGAAEIVAYGFGAGADLDAGFTHGVGHGVGVSLHEAPSLTASEELRVGDVVTVEPGVYDPEKGGVRIEDLVVVTEDGFENLTDYPRSSTPRVRR